ncbi:MAG TPA: YciI family protein [Jiangellaceae bacterium]
MRYLITVNHEGPIDEGIFPEQLYADMGAFVEKLAADGILVDAAGLERLDKATRVSLNDGDVKVVDGPFSEAKEWIGGYFILQVRSHAEAVEYARQSIELHRKHVPNLSVSHEVRRIEED